MAGELQRGAHLTPTQKLKALVKFQKVHIESLGAEVERLKKEVQHWKANHDEQVRRKRVGQQKWKERAAELRRRVVELEQVIKRTASVVADAASELEPYRDGDGWGDGVTEEDIEAWAELQTAADWLNMARDPDLLHTALEEV